MNPKQVWQAVLGELQVRLSRPQYETWLKNTTLYSVEDDVAVVSVPTSFAQAMIEKKFEPEIRRSLTNILGRPIEVVVSVNGVARHNDGPNDPVQSTESVAAPEPAQSPVVFAQGKRTDFGSAGTPLNPKYQFDNFIVGSTNRMAHAACQAVAEHPSEAYNPLFLYGGVGLGKTHLLHATGNEALLRRTELSILYVSSETFTNDLINSIREHRTDDFRARYRAIDILLIDDIQFIAGKERRRRSSSTLSTTCTGRTNR